MGDLLHWLDLFGVAVFAVSGSLTASRKQLDIVGFLFVAAVTGIGGGTLRDLLLNHGPVFWVREPLVLWLTSAMAVLVYFTASRVERRYPVLLWADAWGSPSSASSGRRRPSRRKPRPASPSSWAP